MDGSDEATPRVGLRRRLRQLSPIVPRGRYTALAAANHALGLERDRLRAALREQEQVLREKNHIAEVFSSWVPPGHFYSPFPDLAEFDKRSAQLLSPDNQPAAIDLREREQLALFDELAPLIDDAPFPADRGDEYRYHLDNPAYSWADGLILHAMLRHVRPRRVVEVGSGYSSALLLDTAERWLDPGVELTFVEPHDELLRSLLHEGDDRRVTILDVGIQDVPVDVFAALQAGDVLFIDSTHVVKAGSDVNHLFFEVLPSLSPGVVVHVHDIFFPFEYRAHWVREGRAWQETYLVRAFLMYNEAFEIIWFHDLMWSRHRSVVEHRAPSMARAPGGNLWLRKVR